MQAILDGEVVVGARGVTGRCKVLLEQLLEMQCRSRGAVGCHVGMAIVTCSREIAGGVMDKSCNR